MNEFWAKSHNREYIMRRAITVKYTLYNTLGISIVLCVVLAMGVQSIFFCFSTKHQTEMNLKDTAEQTITKIASTVAELVASYSVNEYENIINSPDDVLITTKELSKLLKAYKNHYH